MVNKFKNHSLLICCITGLIIYHSINIISDTPLNLLKDWFPKNIELKMAGKTLASLSIPTPVTRKNNISLDASSQGLRNGGYILNFLGGRIPDFIFSGHQHPYQRYYLREEIPYQYLSTIESLKDHYKNGVHKLIQALKGQGITLVILPVPTKISIERHRLPHRLPYTSLISTDISVPQNQTEQADKVYQAFIDAAPQYTVDIFTPLTVFQKSQPHENVYVPADTHWSSLGIGLAAQAILSHLQGLGWNLQNTELRYENKMAPRYDFDFLQALQLPPSFLQTWKPFQWFEPIYFIPPVTTKKHQGRILLAGSCYSKRLNEEKYGLGSILGKALDRLFIDGSMLNGTATEPIKRMVDRKWVLQKGDLFIWEFPVRRPPALGESFPIPYTEKSIEGKDL